MSIFSSKQSPSCGLSTTVVSRALQTGYSRNEACSMIISRVKLCVSSPIIHVTRANTSHPENEAATRTVVTAMC